MSTGYNDIRAALTTQLSTMTGLPAGGVAWPNKEFRQPNPPAMYLRPSLLFAPTIASNVGQPVELLYSGIYQISIFAPSNDSAGDVPVYQMGDLLISGFKTGSALSYGSITRITIMKSVIGPLLFEADWLQVPISITFNATGMA